MTYEPGDALFYVPPGSNEVAVISLDPNPMSREELEALLNEPFDVRRDIPPNSPHAVGEPIYYRASDDTYRWANGDDAKGWFAWQGGPSGEFPRWEDRPQ